MHPILRRSLLGLLFILLVSPNLAPPGLTLAKTPPTQPPATANNALVSPAFPPAQTQNLPPAQTATQSTDPASGDQASLTEAPATEDMAAGPSAGDLRLPKNNRLVYDPAFQDPLLPASQADSANNPASPDLRQPDLRQPYTRQPDLRPMPYLRPMPPAEINFDGVGNLNGYVPPDPTGAVGPNHYVQMVNVAMGIFSKTGTLLYGPFYPNTLWPSGDPCRIMNDGDPVVLYDQLADRWLISQFIDPGPPYYECFAISKTAPPPTCPPIGGSIRSRSTPASSTTTPSWPSGRMAIT